MPRNNKLLQAAKTILFDTGFGFGVAGALMFFAASPMGFVGCIVAATSVAGIKALQVINPPFLQKDNWFTRIVKDDRTPLRLLGLSMLVVMGATLSQNAVDLWTVSSSVKDFISKGMVSTILPAFASSCFAVCNFKFASAISDSLKIKTPDNAATPAAKKKIIPMILSRPETYLSLGMIAMGLMTGGAAMLSFPFIATGYAATMKNILQNRPPHVGHPDMHFAGMSGILSCAGFATGQPVLGVAYLINAAALAHVEALTTPGGFAQVMRDMKQGVVSLVHKIRGGQRPPESAVALQVEIVPEAASTSTLPPSNSLSLSFAPIQGKKPDVAAAITTAAPAPALK